MEIEFFCQPDEALGSGTSIGASAAFEWYIDLGLSSENLQLREHDKQRARHYAAGSADIEYDFPFGRSELEGIAHRGDFDLAPTHGDERQGSALLRRPGERSPTRGGTCRTSSSRRPAPTAATLAFLCEAYSEDESRRRAANGAEAPPAARADQGGRVSRW